MENENVARLSPRLAREYRAEVSLDLLGVLVSGPAQPLADAHDMGVDDDALRGVPEHAEDDVRGLSPDPGQLQERVHVSWHFAAVLLDESACKADDGLCLTAEEAERGDERLDRCRLDARERPSVGESGEEGRRGFVHADVGRLRRQDDRDDELER